MKHTPGEIKSFYELLGFNRTASEEEIKKAYKTEALKCHPDKNPGQEKKATVKFQKLLNAFVALVEYVNNFKYNDFPTPKEAEEEAEKEAEKSSNSKRAWGNFYKFDFDADFETDHFNIYEEYRKRKAKKDSEEEAAKSKINDDICDEINDDVDEDFPWEVKMPFTPDSKFLENMIEPFLKNACFDGFDGPGGFYQVYGNLFARISNCDIEFWPSKKFVRPHFGSSNSSYDKVVKPFYNYWLSYKTYKSYIDQGTLKFQASSRKKYNDMSLTRRDIFQRISEEDVKFWKDDKFKRPSFGYAESSIESVVEPFYDNWLSYNSYETFCCEGPKFAKDKKFSKNFEKNLNKCKKIEMKRLKKRDKEVVRIVKRVQNMDPRLK
ncbi:DNAJC21 [Cordylochernes scorpioides]|uniref:DNAJC21 n=1 Tax=Cordylochernes scorpioides TaxID=51811 RepID=A0ABY6KWY4_9ARAC|nr:DNAJC21 [Cordylochernes scorpioides]